MHFHKVVNTSYKIETLKMSLPIRYHDEDMPFDFPMRVNDVWTANINVDSGQIQDWPENQPAHSLHLKIVDTGSYYLIDDSGKQVASLEQEYVPNDLVPGEYGDYVILEISPTGLITNWPSNPSAEAFEDID